MSTTKTAAKAKAPAAKKAVPAPKKAAPAPKVEKVEKEARILYTIRLEPSVVTKIESAAAKDGVTHAAKAREILKAHFAK